MKNKDYKSLGLLNFEGDVLKAYHIPTANIFLITDDHGFIVESCTKQQLINFFEGEKEITTSYGKTYNFEKEHENAKPRQEDIDAFLSLETDEYYKECEYMDEAMNFVYKFYEAEHSMETARYIHPMFYNGTFSKNNECQPPKPKELLTKEEFDKKMVEDDDFSSKWDIALMILFQYISKKNE
jgi:hypothetical protein